MTKSRKEIKKLSEIADYGAWVLIFLVVLTGILAFNYDAIGERWAKVLEIVGAPFMLGMGFFVFGEGVKRLNEYKKELAKEDADTEGQ